MKPDDAKPDADADDPRHDEVTEAGVESFPASDPPAFAQSDPRKHEEPAAEPRFEPDARGASPKGNTDQLRSDMPSGRTIGKQAAGDPPPAPLGTDDEAAGAAPDAAAVRRAAEAERADAAPASRTMSTDASAAGHSEREVRGVHPGWIAGALLVLLVLLIWLIF